MPPDYEMELAVSLSENKLMGLIETKLNEHREAIATRMDDQDNKLDAMRQDLSALVGTANVPGLIQHQTAMLQTLIDQHAQDAVAQASITAQVLKLTADQEIQGKDLGTIRWFLLLCSAMGKFGEKIYEAILSSGVLIKAIGIGILWFTGWHWHRILEWLRRL